VSYQRGRNISKALLFSGAGIVLVATLAGGSSSQISTYGAVLGLLVFFCGVVATLVLCRCPKCGKTIVIGALNRKTCPRCNKQLVPGGTKGKT
jgi:hypothetical protein